jgi:DNA-directed RNA polymerase subunit K/omega
MDFKKVDAPRSTITRDHNDIDAQTQNIYEAVSILAKRADQIAEDIKIELHDKLEEFATNNESLEEIFENKEQIEVSRFYESLPKAHHIAATEWKENRIYFRRPEELKEEED